MFPQITVHPALTLQCTSTVRTAAPSRGRSPNWSLDSLHHLSARIRRVPAEMGSIKINMALDVRWLISWLKRHMLTYISMAFIANCCVQQQAAWTTASFLCVTMIVGAASHPIRSSFDFFSPQGPNPDAGNQLAPFSYCFSTFTVLKYNQDPGLLCSRTWG